jgi:hypothetical protein
MRHLHGHQERVARLEPHTLAAHLCYELTTEDIKPLVLLVMNVQRSATVGATRRFKRGNRDDERR